MGIGLVVMATILWFGSRRLPCEPSAARGVGSELYQQNYTISQGQDPRQRCVTECPGSSSALLTGIAVGGEHGHRPWTLNRLDVPQTGGMAQGKITVNSVLRKVCNKRKLRAWHKSMDISAPAAGSRKAYSGWTPPPRNCSSSVPAFP